ncbi:MAG: PemK family transcriptional regulator [Lentisphaerae bacterium RIFOXYB12_FULL_65_16]|nr:MAG: PemK family transcriptional regulator [Lentisphaerae bacterium RIFOXYA12_64_32]OGV89757.1 MAG: PemK family transcriptional regulator [Lentisphaerae bacterium RIFOXYB12_FULL_65_16]
MVVRQGDIFWVSLGEPSGSEPGDRHPHVVIQNDVFNASRINTVVVIALTLNLQRAQAPGNVLLAKGEGNLPKKSAVNVSQIFTVDRGQLEQKIGTLGPTRIRQILDGLLTVVEPADTNE